MSLAPDLNPAPQTPILHSPSPPDVVAMGGTVADEVIGFVQGLLMEVTRAVSVLRDDEDVVLRNDTSAPSRGSNKGPGWGKGDRATARVWLF